MRGRVCPQCGAGLEESHYGTGSVWVCASHGIKAYFFDEEHTPAPFRVPAR